MFEYFKGKIKLILTAQLFSVRLFHPSLGDELRIFAWETASS